MQAFAGWEMPLQYSGVVEEHAAVRERVGVFDVSHLGTLDVHGPGAASVVNEVLTNDLGRIGPGRAQYTLCCTDSGGVVDDLIVYLDSPTRLRLVPNAANAGAVAQRLRAAAPAGVVVDDRHADVAVLAVQGPASLDVVSAVGLPAGMEYMAFAHTQWRGSDVTVCRTGYTGERGVELLVPAAAAAQLWDAVLEAGDEAGIQPCGLAARDTLRTEMGYPLHGQDLSVDITPVQARLRWAVGWDKPSFTGKAALTAERERGPARVLRGLVAQDRSIPRPGMSVHAVASEPGGDATGGVIGQVTSGTFSPTLRVGIALALLDPSVANGDEVSVDVRGRPGRFVVTAPPFVSTSPLG
jgi:aminomethyltransferase